MLSHLRFHRRGPLSPASPASDQHPTSPPTGQPSSFPTDVLSSELRPTSSNSSALPPTLPPITRVTSDQPEQPFRPRQDAVPASQLDPRTHHSPRSPFNKSSSFIGGVLLRNYQRDMEAHNVDHTDAGNGLGLLGQRSAPQSTLSPPSVAAPTRPAPHTLKNTKAASSFSTPTEFQISSGKPTGRRSAGTRLATDMPALGPTTSNTENSKPRKSLPFLKNPMSTLLMRRKTSLPAPDLLPLPLTNRKEEPIYDPRIKGTRVHDFNAPRKTSAPSTDPARSPYPPFNSGPSPLLEQERFPNTVVAQPERPYTPVSAQRNPSNASEATFVQDPSTDDNVYSGSSAGYHGSTAQPPSPPQRTAPPVPPKDDGPISVQPRSPQASRLIEDGSSIYARSSDSLRTGRSRGASMSGLSAKDVPTAVPRHMKSTSSRFSFDMIGAAKQEKLLEDRHRQRELDKKIAGAEIAAPRDSRFDDFDDDAFDYDAMMDDDGYEEEIPMVGEDLADNFDGRVDDSVDPDNDQENFSGFVFQRSNPTSELTSPRSAGFLPTPRDTHGDAIGLATSQYPVGLPGAFNPNASIEPQLSLEAQPAGLGIQGLDVPAVATLDNDAAFYQNQQLPPPNLSRPANSDDLYFDDGMLGYEKNEFAEDLAASPEWDDTPFDESIFDNNDTDQFGRPIAGAFAQAQTMRNQTQDLAKRESDITSRHSADSDVSRSTAHTSLSVNGKMTVGEDQEHGISGSLSPSHHAEEPAALPEGHEPMSDYQAALAAAAYKAAASGKFQRGSSPVTEEPWSFSLGQLPSSSQYDDNFDIDALDNYNYEDMADFELDDDAIVAEANASALANDSDGWYGQEFGFYSAPTHQTQANAPDDYQYANGGFFGPKDGLDRSISGRMISREPNLTPITERSEYSNRNSMMSLSMPGFSSMTPLQSPSLAQLALLGDRVDDMSLSTLLRLRSKAWGGSQTSLVSSQNGSPRSERGDYPSSPWGGNLSSPPATTFHARKNSALSSISHDSDNCSMAGSPTLTGIPGFSSPPPPVPPLPQLDIDLNEAMNVPALHVKTASGEFEIDISPVTDVSESVHSSCAVSPLDPIRRSDTAASQPSPLRPTMGHRHNGSADSISYTKEEDSGATRWVMERRRTGESGQVEILEREIVEGGRI